MSEYTVSYAFIDNGAYTVKSGVGTDKNPKSKVSPIVAISNQTDNF